MVGAKRQVLLVLAGLAMSPQVVAAFPVLLDVFGGHQSARTLHFFGFVAITAFVVVPRIQSEHREMEAFASADDMAILLNNDDFEMLEDIEFYAWLDSNPNDASEHSSDDDDNVRS